VLGLAAAPLACSDGTPAGTVASQNGSIDLALTTHGVVIGSVSYVITGPNGFSKSGSADVSRSSTIATTIGALPPGTGYSITLSATPTSGATTCSGSAPFSVVAQQTLPVSVDLMCHQARTTGSVMINGSLNVCAQLTDASATPNEVAVGGMLGLSAAATDSDGPQPISYHWTAASGTFADASAQLTQFTCTTPGMVTISVSVSDGDPACADPGSVVVNCLDDGTMGGSGGMSATGGAGGAAAGSSNSGAGTGGNATGGSNNSAGTGGTAGGANGGAGASSGGAGAGGAGGMSGAPGAGMGGAAGAAAGAGGSAGTSTGGAGNSSGGASAGGAAGASAGAAGGGAGGAGAGGAGAGGAGGNAGTAGAGGTSSSRDVVVYRVGNGSGSLVNTGNPVFIDEYTAAGAPVRSTLMPVADSGSTHALVASGTATSEGLISLSTDEHYVLLSGYDSSLPASSSLAGSSVARVVGRLDALGNVDTSTALTDWAPGNNPRSVASTDGMNLWVAGAAGGVRFTTLGATTSTQLSTTVSNIRQTNIFASQLYVSDSSGSSVRLGTVGSGLPTTSGQTITNLTGIPTNGSPYEFFFADLDGNPGLDTVYVADDGSGLQKYALVGTTWTAEGVVGSATDTYRGVTGIVSNGSVTLFAVRKGGSTATGGGELVTLVDASGSTGAFAATPMVLATAGANEAFRGVALAPLP
jgi:hypothetical protein